MVCVGACGAAFHAEYAAKEFSLNPADVSIGESFRCDPFAMQRSGVILRSRERSPVNSDGLAASAALPSVTLDDLINRLKHSVRATDELTNQLKLLSDSIDGKLAQIQSFLTGMRHDIADIRADVQDLSYSRDKMLNRIATIEASAEGARLEVSRVRDDGLALRSQLAELDGRLSIVESEHGPASPDITVSGLPLSVSDSPRDMVLKVFRALGIPELGGDILDVCILTRKSGGAVGDRRGSSIASTALPTSLIVVLKSSCVRDSIISKKREHIMLTMKNVSAIDEPENVSIKQFLPAPIYSLLRRINDLASRAGFTYVWARSGSICVRKSMVPRSSVSEPRLASLNSYDSLQRVLTLRTAPSHPWLHIISKTA